jgi:hypothetical protein
MSIPSFSSKTLGYGSLAVLALSFEFFGGCTPTPSVFSDDANGYPPHASVEKNNSRWIWDGNIPGALEYNLDAFASVTSDSTGSAYKAPHQSSADHYVQFNVASISNATGPFVACRLADRNNFVGVRVGNNGGDGVLELYRRVSGSLTSLHVEGAGTVALNDKVRLECVGTNWEVFLNGVSLASGAIGDASLTSPDTGLVARVVTSNPWIDDFETGVVR